MTPARLARHLSRRRARRSIRPAMPVIERSAAAVAAIIAKGEPVYGINTGFGKLANVHIPPADLATLQRNIVLSHSAGVGAPMPVPVARLMMALKLASLAQGASGVRLETVRLLEALLAKGLTPVVPCQGSVGASGDLAPLAHMSATMIGVGEMIVDGRTVPAANGAGRCRPRAADARRQGRSRAAERHAVLDRLCAGRAVRDRDAVPVGAGHRRPVDRRRARLRCAVRSAHPRAAPPSRPDRDGRRAARPDGRLRDPRLASGRRRARAGPLLPALPAAGHGRRARPPAPGGDDAGDRGQRRHRQSADLRRHRRGPVRRQLPRRAGRLRRRHRSRWRSARSARWPSGASPCWSIRRCPACRRS